MSHHPIPNSPDSIPIVLTGTIIPNAIDTAIVNAEARKRDYLRSIAFYQQWATVHFLENSVYEIEKDRKFAQTPHLHIWKFPPSKNPERGKGFQEFEMLDAWISTVSPRPRRWIKVTGRYLIENIGDILYECGLRKECSMIVDQVPSSKSARTYLFCINSEFYQRCLSGAYQECDDTVGHWIEREVYKRLLYAPNVESFRTQPRILATSGSSGRDYPKGLVQWILKQCLRSANRYMDRRYLWYSR